MTKRLKVYGWTDSRPHTRGPNNPHGQTREILAAHSVAELLRITGMTRHQWNVGGCETGNADEIRIATERPGIIFYQPLNQRTDTGWTADESKVGQQ